VARLEGLAARRNELFARDVAAGAGVLADSVSEAAHAAFHVVNGDQDTWWSAAPGATLATLDLKLHDAAWCSVLRLQEPIVLGQAIEQFDVQGETPGGWRTLATGSTIGYCRLVRFPRTRCNRLRITLRSRLDTIRLSSVGLFNDSGD
jgi:alpha-L-fucosidase